MTQIPHAEKNSLKCPLWRKPMHQVCHNCPMWIAIRGIERNTGREVDEWRCSLSVLPHLMIESTWQMRGTAAATEQLRNVIVDGLERANNGIEHKREKQFEDFIPPVARIK